MLWNSMSYVTKSIGMKYPQPLLRYLNLPMGIGSSMSLLCLSAKTHVFFKFRPELLNTKLLLPATFQIPPLLEQQKKITY